jgi:hypothetical protein
MKLPAYLSASNPDIDMIMQLMFRFIEGPSQPYLDEQQVALVEAYKHSELKRYLVSWDVNYVTTGQIFVFNPTEHFTERFGYTDDVFEQVNQLGVGQSISIDGMTDGCRVIRLTDKFRIGDVVNYDVPGYGLRSGSQSYGGAVVISVDPFILASTDADMRWSNVDRIDYLVKIGEATPETLALAATRLRD